MKKKGLIIGGVTGGIIILVLIGLILAGYFASFGPFSFLFNNYLMTKEGNAEKYSVAEVIPDENSSLKGKKIAFLGSSVTYGYAALGESFADFLEAKYGVIKYKEAVSGTTLADIDNQSYVSRFSNFSTDLELDLFVLQLSTNDASKGVELGDISSSDKTTSFGAINYIYQKVEEQYNCPILIYTNHYYQNETYQNMVALAEELCKDESDNLYLLNLYDDEEFNSITSEERNLYMFDNIHPTRCGYQNWWLPEFEEVIAAICQ